MLLSGSNRFHDLHMCPIYTKFNFSDARMSDTDDFVEELYCPICADLYEEPLMLPCTHSFCAACLRERLLKGPVTKTSQSVKFDCPVCRNEVILGEKGVDGLPSNRLLK